MSTLLERIERIRQLRAEDGKELPYTTLSERAGMNRTALSTYVGRLKKDPAYNIGTATLRKLAKAGGVRYAWLADGQGQPEGAEAGEELEQLVEVALQMAASDGFATTFLERWRFAVGAGRKPTFGEVWHRLNADYSMWVAGQAAAHAATEASIASRALSHATEIIDAAAREASSSARAKKSRRVGTSPKRRAAG